MRTCLRGTICWPSRAHFFFQGAHFPSPKKEKTRFRKWLINPFFLALGCRSFPNSTTTTEKKMQPVALSKKNATSTQGSTNCSKLVLVLAVLLSFLVSTLFSPSKNVPQGQRSRRWGRCCWWQHPASLLQQQQKKTPPTATTPFEKEE